MNVIRAGKGRYFLWVFLLGLASVSIAREIPSPLADHPGNICLEGERY